MRSSASVFGQAPARNAHNYIRPYTEAFQYGANLGYYNANWNDDQLAAAGQALGVHSVRPTLPEYFVEGYGYNIRANTFNAYVTTYGMKELTCFVEGPSSAHRDNTIYPGGTQPSRLFARLYEPIWNADGTVNPNNYYAIYLFKLQQIYGDKIRYWEIVNEPDFTYGQNQRDWLTRPPLPDEVTNLRAPIFHYIRMLRISYEVLKKYRPDSYITTGGVGYPQFVDCLLRYTDNPNGGAVTAQYPHKAGAYLDALSFHSYPTYSLHSWDISINNFRYTRSSDFAVNKMLKERQDMVDVLTKYGYGSTYPAKTLLMSETNVSRRTSADRTASDEGQRNYTIKSLVLAQRHAIKQFYIYQLGESVNAPPPGTSVNGTDELALMGLYENLKRDAPGSQKATQSGQAFATTSKLLYGWTYDEARTTALALPNSLNGAAFRKNGVYAYVLWAKALVDNQESATGTYTFPAALNLTTLQRYAWNHATTNARNTVFAQNVALTETPQFFIEDGTGVVATSINPTSAVVGATVTLTGVNLAGATRVSFNGTNRTTFSSNTATQIVLTVPSGATSGPVTVTTPAGTSNAVAFTVAGCPAATLAYGAATYCQSGTNPTPTVTGPTGGTYTAPAGLSVSATTGAINLAASSPGTYTVTYRVASGLCPASATASVTITAAPVAAFSYGAASYCTNAGGPVAAVLGAGASAGRFTATPGGLALDANSGEIALASSQPGTYTVTNTIGAASGCAAATATAQVTIAAVPAAALNVPSGATSFCNGSTVMLSAGNAQGVSYQFNFDGQPIAGATSHTFQAQTSGTYTVTVSTAGGCTATSSPVVLTAEPAPATPSLAMSAPSPGLVLLTSSAPSGNRFYHDGRVLPGSHGQTYFITSPAQNGVYTVVTSSARGCDSGHSTAVAVNMTSLVTSTTTALAGSTLNVYPNPTLDGQLTVELAGYRKGVQLSVVNALGQVVFESKVAAGQALPTLDLHHLPAGVYSLRAKAVDGVATRRFVRQ